jgi:hypothetical protein
MGKGKAAGFHSWADGFAVCGARRTSDQGADRGEYREAAGAATQNLIEVASPKRYLVPLPSVVAATSVVCADCSDATEDTLAEGVDSAQQV